MAKTDAASPPFLTEQNIKFYAIELDPGEIFPEVLRQSCYVYALVSEDHNAALINTGPAVCREQLLEKLKGIGVRTETVTRVVLTNWDVRHVGNLPIFENAIAYALSPDQIKPYNYAAVLEHQRYRLRSLLEELESVEKADHICLGVLENDKAPEATLEDFIGIYYSAPNVLPFVPLKQEDQLNLLGLHFEVIDLSAFFKGQLALYYKGRKLLFGFASPSVGLPDPFYSLAAVVPMLERLAGIDLEIVASNHDGVETKPQWLIKHSRAFMKSFFDNAPSLLRKKPTLLQFLDQNFGRSPDNIIELLFELVKYQDALNELARDEEITIEGSGIANRRYGLNVIDPRHPKLQF